ncbi:hypothetical protein Cgig2_034026 [Carnegiea gigantea]|uniref:Endonuclease/exonuclease/phosphatase domain-containing protein n=1 Tax=Carnegiea gigantea TaxID=171969 RepID=A0A9Q1JMV3_9CARY|nr:hypothetical protein Cgig2_034026 [Carnegiea gigantea]
MNGYPSNVIIVTCSATLRMSAGKKQGADKNRDERKWSLQLTPHLPWRRPLLHPKTRMLATTVSFHVTFVYGMNKEQQRLPLWTDLMDIARIMSSAWCVIGDFNAILYKLDRIGGDKVTTHDISKLSTLLEHSELHELRSMGAYYSWTNKQVWSRINRAFINDHWCGSFDYTHSIYMANGLSDHAPILLQFPNAPKPQIRFSLL